MLIRYLAFLFILVLLSSCRVYDSPAEYKGRQLKYGKGGGVTGAWEQYVLLGNGQVFYRNFQDTVYAELGYIPRKEAKKIFKGLIDAHFYAERFNEPGNMTYFIFYKDNDESHGLQWGSGTFKTPQSILDLYNRLMKLELKGTKKLKKKDSSPKK
ncbi:MAG: hypothetical protein M3Q97_10285 [Bacteroidota bacterium]|nr:hypothetical protein [Bacteroidota bacterium]